MRRVVCVGLLVVCAWRLGAAGPAEGLASAWPRDYSVRRDRSARLLTLTTPYYVIQHDLRRGGVIARIQLTHGRATNLLLRPLETHVRDADGTLFTDRRDPRPRVSHQRAGSRETVTTESRLLDDRGRPAGIKVKTVFQYGWGYVRIHKEFAVSSAPLRVRELSVLSTVLVPSLSTYGYREGLTEQEGAPPFAFGSNRWGQWRKENGPGPLLETAYVPRSMIFADAGVEGLEWFVSSDLAQWELQLTGRRGQGQCLLQPTQDPPGLALSIAPLWTADAPVPLPPACAFDFYLGIPLLEGHAQRPWLHASFNRNRGQWVPPEQIQRWAEAGIQTVHCHNDGDYYDDGLFWRDGSYPPYPDMEQYDEVLRGCHQAGLRVATYFSNKELHPSTAEFQAHGTAWGRQNHQGQLQHNLYRGTNEFGVQMCLRSGWLEFLKSSIDRVLRNHPLDGVYYDWNVALFCCNPLHEGRAAGTPAAGHWDIDELLDLMEWTRRRVGQTGLIIVHNTTTPMFVMENFADFVVANEWGYGKWSGQGPTLADLPLEWSLVGARRRGVISYGQLDTQAPRELHRRFALYALLSGVTPWPASPEAAECARLLRPLGDFASYRFLDWRNQAVTLTGTRCASAVYSRPGEAYLLLANLDSMPQEVRCRLYPDQLSYPLAAPIAATILGRNPQPSRDADLPASTNLDVRAWTREGLPLTLPANGLVLLQLR